MLNLGNLDVLLIFKPEFKEFDYCFVNVHDRAIVFNSGIGTKIILNTRKRSTTYLEDISCIQYMPTIPTVTINFDLENRAQKSLEVFGVTNIVTSKKKNAFHLETTKKREIQSKPFRTISDITIYRL